MSSPSLKTDLDAVFERLLMLLESQNRQLEPALAALGLGSAADLDRARERHRRSARRNALRERLLAKLEPVDAQASWRHVSRPSLADASRGFSGPLIRA